MSLIEDIPEELRSHNKQGELIEYLKLLPVPLHTKKYLLLDWCEFTGVKMKREFAEAIGIPVEI